HARQQLLERERLDQIVVGAGVQALHAVLDAVARGQHEHVRPVRLLAQAREHAQAVELGQQEIEHEDVVGIVARVARAELAVAGDVDGESGAREADTQRLAQGLGILDDQYAHLASGLGCGAARRRAGYSVVKWISLTVRLPLGAIAAISRWYSE